MTRNELLDRAAIAIMEAHGPYLEAPSEAWGLAKEFAAARCPTLGHTWMPDREGEETRTCAYCELEQVVDPQGKWVDQPAEPSGSP